MRLFLCVCACVCVCEYTKRTNFFFLLINYNNYNNNINKIYLKFNVDIFYFFRVKSLNHKPLNSAILIFPKSSSLSCCSYHNRYQISLIFNNDDYIDNIPGFNDTTGIIQENCDVIFVASYTSDLISFEMNIFFLFRFSLFWNSFFEINYLNFR